MLVWKIEAYFWQVRGGMGGRPLNTLPTRQNGRLFADDSLELIFLYQNCCILLQISLTFVPKGSIDNKPALVQIMAWRQTANNPLSEPKQVYSSLLMLICISWPWLFIWIHIGVSLCWMPVMHHNICSYHRQTSNISHTNSQHLNVSRLILQLSLPFPLKPVVKSGMQM